MSGILLFQDKNFLLKFKKRSTESWICPARLRNISWSLHNIRIYMANTGNKFSHQTPFQPFNFEFSPSLHDHAFSPPLHDPFPNLHIIYYSSHFHIFTLPSQIHHFPTLIWPDTIMFHAPTWKVCHYQWRYPYYTCFPWCPQTQKLCETSAVTGLSEIWKYITGCYGLVFVN